MLPGWARSMSLSLKLPLLVGAAITLVVLIALTPPWLRMRDLVRAGQRETSRELLAAWATLPPSAEGRRPGSIGDARVRVLTLAEAGELAASGDAALAEIVALLDTSRDRAAAFTERWEGVARRSAYAAVLGDGAGDAATIVVLERTSEGAGALLAVNAIYMLAAGAVVLAVALVAFYLITSKLVLRPLRSLRLWAEAVRDGNTDERVEVRSGDEFQQLAETCSIMLDGLRDQQRRLRAMNASLDVKLNEMAEANDALDRGSRLKGEFVANMSHELRTPLNAIIGFGELLLDLARDEAKRHTERGENPPPQIEQRLRYLDNIVRAARGLLGLIEGMLDLARLEAGRAELRPERVDVAELCRGAVAMMQPQAQKQGVSVTLEATGPALIESDARKLQQIVFNLLSNAVKFTAGSVSATRPGRVVVRVERLVGEAEAGALRVSVIDNGPGIAPEDQQRVFQKFEQLDSRATREFGGAGLGLAISKELALLLQGEIQLVSDLGEGSMFSLILPEALDRTRAEEQQLESRFRGILARS